MNYEDWMASDTMRAIAKILPPDDPNNPRNLARAAEAARKAAEAAAAASPVNVSPSAEAPPPPEVQPIDALEPAPAPKKRRKRRKPRVRQRSAPVRTRESARSRHERVCTVCNHEERDAIDEEFVNWFRADDIAAVYDLDERAVYRHARATGLHAARERNVRAVLGHILERATIVTPTVDGILRAVRAYSCLDRQGRWTEPPAHVVVSSGAQLARAKVIADSEKVLQVLPTGAPQDSSDV